MKKPILRCAIYTRKSTEEGLEQSFNSLHAQREACVSYIASQKHEGWQLVRTHYDDGGFSGGHMGRPALKQLLEDIGAGKVNVVVVYKVDRLTRSLTDFAKIIERFDQQNVSFVSVTQQFNTTSSMGRLTLNVLLSFAQFEREVTSERIRDKIAASKKKGMWMGGVLPLGYNLNNRKLLINPKEAQTVQYIYRCYLEFGCVRLLKKELDKQGILSKACGQKISSPFSRGSLYKILSNPIYIGQICHKGARYQGQHEAIIDLVLWEQVRQLMADNRIEHKTHFPNTTAYPLMNKLYDVSGERLVSNHANKKGRRYRYYISEGIRANQKDTSGNGWRLPALEIEHAIAHATFEIINDQIAVNTALQESKIAAHFIPYILNEIKNIQFDTNSLIDTFARRVELQQNGISLTLSLSSLMTAEMGSNNTTITRDIPMQMRRRGIEMRMILNGNNRSLRVDQTLLKTIVRAHRWFNDLVSGRVKSVAEIVSKEGIDKGYISRALTLAFLAPDIIERIITGHQPADLCIEKLMKRIDLPLDWAQQRQLLGFI